MTMNSQPRAVWRWVLATVAASAVLTGCGSSDTGEQQASAGTTSTSTTAAKPTVTVQDFAAIVAEHHADWDDQVQTTESNCLDPDLVPVCSAGYMTLGLKAQTLALELSGAQKPGVPAYIGEPPSEIADLVADTEQAATAVQTAVDALQAAGCADPMELACSKQRIDLKRAIDDLSGKLDAWSVY